MSEYTFEECIHCREKLKHKQKNENASVLLQAKDTEIATLKSVSFPIHYGVKNMYLFSNNIKQMLEAGKLELSDLRTR